MIQANTVILRSLLSVSAAVAMLLGASSSAHAQSETQASDKAACDVLEVRASNDEGGIDKELSELSKKLKRPPFSAWKTFKLVAKHSDEAELMTPLEVKLKTGGKLGLLYKSRSDKKGKKTRLSFGLTLDSKSGKRKADMSITVDSGDYTLLGRDAEKDGSSHILAIRCTAK